MRLLRSLLFLVDHAVSVIPGAGKDATPLCHLLQQDPYDDRGRLIRALIAIITPVPRRIIVGTCRVGVDCFQNIEARERMVGCKNLIGEVKKSFFRSELERSVIAEMTSSGHAGTRFKDSISRYLEAYDADNKIPELHPPQFGAGEHTDL